MEANAYEIFMESMHAYFMSLPKDQQIRKLILAGNAEFILRMLTSPSSELEKIVVEALSRGLDGPYIHPTETPPPALDTTAAKRPPSGS